MVQQIKEILINHCAPVIMGIKPAALFRAPHIKCAHCLGNILSKKINLEILYNADSGVLLLAYDYALLKNMKLGGDSIFLLEKLGYSKISEPEKIIEHLKERFKTYFKARKFPHEVGFFLGYPEKDVLGFIKNCAQGYKTMGLWKVYGEVETAEKMFESFNRCSQMFRKRLKNCIDIKKISAAVAA